MIDYNNILFKLKNRIKLSYNEFKSLNLLFSNSDLSSKESYFKTEILNLKNKEGNKIDFPYRDIITDVSLWTPDQEFTSSELVNWYDAAETDYLTGEEQDYLVLNGSNLAQWDDRSGNNRHMTQGVGSSQPPVGASTYFTRSVNLLSGDSMIVPSNISGNDNRTLVIIGQLVSWGEIFKLSASTARWHAETNASKIRFYQPLATPSWSLTTTAYSPWTQPCIISWSLDGLYSVDQYGRRQGLQKGVSGAAGQEVKTGTSNGELKGQSNSIVEIILIKGTLNQEQHEKIEGYAAHKWGFAANLEDGHPYKNSAP